MSERKVVFSPLRCRAAVKGPGAGLRVLVADDHPVFVDGVARVLPEHAPVSVVATCRDGHTALASIVEIAPDVALIDLRMPGMDGRAVVAAVRRHGTPTRVVVCSALEHPAVVDDLLRAGAAGYVSKQAGWEELAEAVLEAAGGRVYVSPRLRTGLADRVVRGARCLSDRERTVVALAAEGLTDAEIARKLIVSHDTVRTNLKRAGDKLCARGRAGIVAEALREGVFS